MKTNYLFPDLEKMIGTYKDDASYLYYKFKEEMDKGKDACILAEVVMDDRSKLLIMLKGKPIITNFLGNEVSGIKMLGDYFKTNKHDELSYDSVPYVEIVMVKNKRRFVGIYHNVQDALHRVDQFKSEASSKIQMVNE